jgi:Na+-translocating ferredoxin:NAD+ oxidoreductase RnfE subunit
MHYQFHPFADMKGSITMLPIIKAFETGYGLLIVATVVVLLMLLPYLAYEEEKLFRYKRVTIPAILRGCILFGRCMLFPAFPSMPVWPYQ